MKTTQVKARETEPTEKVNVQLVQPPLRLLLALASLVATFCFTLEIQLIGQLDSLRLYMTYSEIAADASVALIIVLAMALLWWLCLVALLELAQVAGTRALRYRNFLLWRFGLIIPLAYLSFTLLNTLRLSLLKGWHPGVKGWLMLATVLLGLCVLIVCRTTIGTIQEFCRIRLVPVAWLHVGVAIVAVILLWGRGVHQFHDYSLPSSATASELPDIYLITIDTLRADDMSLYGYPRGTTPSLERFARRAYVFDFFFANSNFTTSTTTSIETGKLPWSHRVFHLGGFLHSNQDQNLAAVLHQHGYYTATLSSNFIASPVQHKTLASYDDAEFFLPQNASAVWLRYTNFVGLNTLWTLSSSLFSEVGGLRFYLDSFLWSKFYWAPPEPVFQRAKEIIERRDIKQPRFIWAHILPPHDPYLAPPPCQRRFLASDKLLHNYSFIGLRNETLPAGTSVEENQARYDEATCYADRELGNFLDWLEQTGRLDRSIVIISADHGESFEHSWYLHAGRYMYNGVIHIPLLIHLPGQVKGQRMEAAAEQIDLLPTILDLIGVPIPSWSEGTSLKPALEGRSLPQRMLFSMNLEPNSTFAPISKGTIVVMDDQFKYVKYLISGQQELYRYKLDPREEHNLMASEPEVADRIHQTLADRLQQVNKSFLAGRK